MATEISRPAGEALRPASRRAHIPVASRPQQIVDLLREEIVSGTLKAGQQLKQDELREDFGVSPGPVREALRVLENEGLVEHFPNRGVFVADISATDLIGVLIPVRLAIEMFAVTAAAPALRAGGIADLENLIEQMRVAAERNDRLTINELDVRFHETIVRASASSHALQLWRSVQPRIRAQIYALAPRHHAADDIVAEHQQIVDAIRDGDDEKLKAVITEHVQITPLRLLGAGDAG
ncbi:GntR family transcriptional regulator [Acrocarpospora macrocephala]|uniref:GntR family transcriptional regulator n=1 Tax=Acrocarpospora macrocephala TaxID=150177 RepID=A0A5M3WFW1_9ACTN|nr:GntR family transcriptional regulator [Acrocarpospora macrocephala]GES07229.1 GntR family transcriptional regulator [Acrocarpospora macrocephala]